MSLKVGDKVKVRSDLEEGMPIPFGVNNGMVKFAGTECTISEVVGVNNYLLSESITRWNWCEEMFEPIEKEKTLETTLVNLKAKVSIENYDEVKSQIEKLDEMLKNLKIKFILE